MPNADCDEPWSELLAVLGSKAAVSLEASDLVETADVDDWGVFGGEKRFPWGIALGVSPIVRADRRS